MGLPFSVFVLFFEDGLGFILENRLVFIEEDGGKVSIVEVLLKDKEMDTSSEMDL